MEGKRRVHGESVGRRSRLELPCPHVVSSTSAKTCDVGGPHVGEDRRAPKRGNACGPVGAIVVRRSPTEPVRRLRRRPDRRQARAGQQYRQKWLRLERTTQLAANRRPNASAGHGGPPNEASYHGSARRRRAGWARSDERG